MLRVNQVLLLLLVFLFSFISEAGEVRYLLRSPRALLMGDAYTALANDEFTLFYNPASLAKNEGFEMSPLNPRLGLTNVYDDLDRFEDFPDDASGIADRVMDYPIYTELGVAPGLKMGGFGLSLLANSTSSIVLRNQTHPYLSVDYRYDRGFVMGYAFDLLEGDERLSVGASLKYITREGLDETYSFFGPELLDAIASDSSDMNAIRENLGYSKGNSWGGDIGVEYATGNKNGQLIMAASLMDVFDTEFQLESGEAEIPDQEMMLNLGTAWRQEFPFFDYSLSFDLHPVNQPVDFGRKIHIGAQLGLPLVRLYGGWNGGYFTYGAGVRFWPFELTAGLYGKELGASFRQNEGKRTIFMLSLFDIDVDL